MARSYHQKTPKGSSGSANDQISDPRFANIQTDPRFRLPSKRNTHVQIDKRFERMLRDDSFSRRAKVDRYGRRLPKEAGKKELERYYRIEDQEDEDTSKQEEEVRLELARAHVQDEDESSSAAEESSSEESEVEESEEDEVFGLLDDQGAEGRDTPLGEITSRLAVVNMDWDNIRAEDLMAVFSSFVPTGQIRRISVYPSAFGKERIEREEVEGPSKDIFARGKASNGIEEGDSSSNDQHSGVEEDDEKIQKNLLQEGNDQEFNSAKLRRYQLERLRYYYAVLICSSPAIAQTIYEAVDGTEYLTTANFFDLRFIPDEVGFSQDKPRDECIRIPDGYRPNEFVTDALQHSKVRLTWDADDITRKGAQKRAFAASRANIDENDLKAYLGSDSSDPEDDLPEPIVVDATAASIVPETENQAASASSTMAPTLSKKEAERQRMRSLLGLSAEPKPSSSKESKSNAAAPVGDMQITFSSGLNPEPNSNNNSSVFTNSPYSDAEPEETTVEKYVRKEKERKARRKAKLKASRNGGAVPSENNQEGNSSSADEKGNDNDLGFNDPFFTSPTTKNPKSNPASASDRKEARRLKKAERAAEEARSAAQRAELELLTLPDEPDAGDEGRGGGRGGRHFDMKEILKAEKAAAKKEKKKGRGSKRRDRLKEEAEREDEDDGNRDDGGFKINVQDPRFAV
ncbi:MAG: hypothetical protein Q9203_005325, partial [Teloschistes exilis]